MLIPEGFGFSFASNETGEKGFFAKKSKDFQVIDEECATSNSSLKWTPQESILNATKTQRHAKIKQTSIPVRINLSVLLICILTPS